MSELQITTDLKGKLTMLEFFRIDQKSNAQQTQIAWAQCLEQLETAYSGMTTWLPRCLWRVYGENTVH